MNRHLARFLAYTAGYLTVVLIGRAVDRIEHAHAVEVDELATAIRALEESRPRQRCLCSVCELARAAG